MFMIKEDKIIVSVNARNISYYRELGYEVSFSNFNDKINLEVPIEQVSKFSKERITAICDVCESETNLSILKYWKNYERGGFNFYSCFSCKNKKKEMTNLEKWGVSSYSQTQEFKEKSTKTFLEKYGVTNPNKSVEIREKIKNTCLEKYGYTHAMLLPEIQEANRIWMSSDEFKEKSKKTLLEKYSVDSYSKTEEFKQKISDKRDEILLKIRKTFLERYGVDSIFKVQSFREKYLSDLEKIEKNRINTCLERYGVTNVSKVSEIMKRIMDTKVEKNISVDVELLGPWEKYKKEVNKLTKRNKSKLFEEWNGLDYYDNEPITKYFGLLHTHRFYPSIDHKISVFYGFKENISPDKISAIDNLCITKRYINSIKKSMIDVEFIEKLKSGETEL